LVAWGGGAWFSRWVGWVEFEGEKIEEDEVANFKEEEETAQEQSEPQVGVFPGGEQGADLIDGNHHHRKKGRVGGPQGIIGVVALPGQLGKAAVPVEVGEIKDQAPWPKGGQS
jgi:hypothetical protein